MSLPYILNTALILAACLAFYKVLLRRETFYKMNRWLLMVCLAASFALPLLQVPEEFSIRKSNVVNRESSIVSRDTKADSRQLATDNKQATVGRQQPTINNSGNRGMQSDDRTTNNLQRGSKFSFDQMARWIIAIYWFGVIVFAASFLFQTGLLIWRAFRYPVINDGPYRIVEVRGDHAPCSFGNIIFINPSVYERETYNQILLHEKIHVRQKHTIDILIAELVLIFQWFNPFAWIYRREIENNLEFLTDDQVVQHKQVDKQSYQLSLVKVSAPYLPLPLTTNYNQSILKTRIAMMNKKRSNLHTAWKYFFLLPLFALLVCLLNEPAKSQVKKNNKEQAANQGAQNNQPSTGQQNRQKEQPVNPKIKNSERNHDIETEGSWFATIKEDKISIQFKSDGEKGDNNFSGNTYKLTELSPVPKEGVTSFKMIRDAGTMEFTGKFEGNTGMGHYKFVANKAYGDFMSSALKEKLDDRDIIVFFFVDAKKEMIADVKSEGYTDVTKDELISLAALDVDKAYIHSIKSAGFKDVSLENLVSFKALGIDDKYIAEIKSAGYKNISTEEIVGFKAQGIDKEYINKVRQLRGKDNDDNDAEAIVSFKAMGIDEAFINSFKAVGMNNIPHEELVAFKAVGVTPDYIKSWQSAGFKDIDPEGYVGMKSQNVTPEYMKSFVDMGYKNITPEHLVSFRALGVTPEYIRSFEAMGYKHIDAEEITGLKAQDISPEYIKSFESAGFKNVSLEDAVGAKATGVTPQYIKEMKAKGLNYDKLQKYITLKTID